MRIYRDSEIDTLTQHMRSAPYEAFWAKISWSAQRDVRDAGGYIASVGDDPTVCCSMSSAVAEDTIRGEYARAYGIRRADVQVRVS